MDKPIHTIDQFIAEIKRDYASWDTETFPWFRGEPDCDTPLLPKLYRQSHDENQLLQFFRMKAPSLAPGRVPERMATDQWLFLAQHVGLPTRLLDWSEGCLIALHFALLHSNPVVWMLDPIHLNSLSLPTPSPGDLPPNVYGLTWVQRQDMVNIGSENIRGAWESDRRGLMLPVATQPTSVHPRMAAQRSCFTAHGKEKESLNKLVTGECLRKYVIDSSKTDDLRRDLRMLGISQVSLFPDLDGLARDLAMTF